MLTDRNALQEPSLQLTVPTVSQRCISTSAVQPTTISPEQQDISPVPETEVENEDVPFQPAEGDDLKNPCLLRCWRFMLRRPLVCLCLQQIVVLVLIAALWKPLDIDTDFESFVRADGDASRQRDGYIHAFKYSDFATAKSGRRLFPRKFLAGVKELHIIYRDKGRDNLLTEKKLLALQRFEQHLKKLPGWRKLCKETGVPGQTSEYNEYWGATCDPGDSFVNYVWTTSLSGSGDSPYRQLEVDGLGVQILPIDAAIDAIKRHKTVSNLEPGDTNALPIHRYFPKVFNAPEGAKSLESDLLSSHFFFHMISGEGATYSSSDEAGKAWEDFVESELHPALIENEEIRNAGIEVFFHGTYLTDHDIFNTLWKDCYLAAGGMILVFFCLLGHSRSSLVAVVGLLLIFESIPLAYVLFLSFSGLAKISIVNCVALFVIIGVGSDIVFVFTDTWRQSSIVAPELGSDVNFAVFQRRLLWTYKSAGKSCAATTLSTAASFLANLASALQPLREFGLFMGLCVIWTYLLVAMICPLLLLRSEMAGLKEQRAVMAESSESSSSPPQELESPKTPLGRPKWRKTKAGSGFFRDILGNWIMQHKKKIVIFFCFISVLFSSCSIVLVKVDDGMPAIFPEGHNQHLIKELRKNFTIALSSYPAAVYHLEACDFSKVSREKPCVDNNVQCPAWVSMGECADNTNFMKKTCPKSCTKKLDAGCKTCLLDWCNVAEPPKKAFVGFQGSTCECFGTNTVNAMTFTSGTSLDYSANVRLRIAGLTEADFLGAAPAFKAHLLQTILPPNSTGGRIDTMQPSFVHRPTFVQEHWRSGKTVVQQAFDLEFVVRGKLSSKPDFAPPVVQHCFCGSMSICNNMGPSLGIVNFTNGNERRLQEDLMDKLTKVGNQVSVVWGIEIEKRGLLNNLFADMNSTEAWSFDENFDPSDPKAQRSIKNLIAQIPAELQVLPGTTWMDDFEWWLESRGGFPSRNFHSDIADFLQKFPNNTEQFLVDPATGRARAVKLEFWVGISSRAPVAEVFKLKEKWDEYIKTRNDDASARAGSAFHTSHLWVRAEAQNDIISSTLLSIFISVLCGFVAIDFFTSSLCLAIFVSFVVLAIMLAQAFFMVVIMGWELGAVEVVALIVFVGYVFTYNLHIAHTYQCYAGQEIGLDISDRRAERVRFALYRMGRSTVGSAMTTLGCSLFLFFCTLRFFVKFGTVIFSVTTLSVIYALVLLPALLMLCGPINVACCGCLPGFGVSSSKKTEPEFFDVCAPGENDKAQ